MVRKGSKVYLAAMEVYGEDKARLATRSMDIIGDIAIIKIPNELMEKRFEFGEKLLEYLPYVETIFRQKSPVRGSYRLRELEFLAGRFKTLTVYKEYGLRLFVDVLRTYFTPRLSTERWRISQMVNEGEIVLNMFAGVGPYSILIAKNRSIDHVYSVDINYDAVKLHRSNNVLNKVSDKIDVYVGDAEQLVEEKFVESVERVIMPLPEKGLEYLGSAVKAIDTDGWIHVYLHVPYKERQEESVINGMERVSALLRGIGVKVMDIRGRRVREVSTRTTQVCIDCHIAK